MFNPTVGSIAMGLAVMACVGSLFGWQFHTPRSRRTQPTPACSRASSPGDGERRAIAGMVIMGVVQTLLALMTISPDLSSQFSALIDFRRDERHPVHSRSIALTVICGRRRCRRNTRTIAISVVGIAYSVYALYASGVQAVMGGMLVMDSAGSSGCSARGLGDAPCHGASRRGRASGVKAKTEHGKDYTICSSLNVACVAARGRLRVHSNAVVASARSPGHCASGSGRCTAEDGASATQRPRWTAS
jgi:putrescine:ornithine antiporter